MSKRMRQLSQILLLGIALCSMSPRGLAVEFAPAKSYPVGTNPAAVAVADFNGDGKPDIAVVNSGSSNVSILLGNGDGTFQSAKNFDVGKSMTSIFAGDFNGDGKLDIAVFLPGDPSNSVTGEVRILLGNGDGTFQPPIATALTMGAVSLKTADFNADKKADLILSNLDPVTQVVTLEILLGKGDGAFQPPVQIPVSALNSAVFSLADFNKDGKPDLAVGISGGAQVLLGKGDGTFQAGGTVAVSDSVPVNAMLTADFNGDGSLDLFVEALKVVCVKPNPFAPPVCTTEGSTGLFPGLGNGTFTSGVSVGRSCSFAGDFNGDAKTDCVADGSIELGRGDGTFSAVFLAAPQGAVASVHDLNGDKLDDLVILDQANNAILVLLNTSPASGADLSILSGGSGARVGQGLNLIYSASVLNEGPNGATNVTFTDTLPGSVSFVSATSTVGNCIQSNLVVTCSIGSLADAADTQITIVVMPTATGTITNTMDVSATEPDLAPANNSATQVDTVVPVYTLAVTKGGDGSGTVRGAFSFSGGFKINCGSTCSASFLSGATVNLSEAPASDSYFQAWGGACSGNSTCSLTMAANMTVSATFVLNPVLTVKIAGGGMGQVTASDDSLSCNNTSGPCSNNYPPGSVVSLTAQAQSGSSFSGWSGACTGTDPTMCSVTLNSDATVTATFNVAPDFSVSPVATVLSVMHGGQVSETLTFAAQGGFSGTIALTCSVTGAAPTPTCGLSPSSVTPGSSSTLTVNTAGLFAAVAPQSLGLTGNLYVASLPFGTLMFLLSVASGKQRRRTWILGIAVLAATLAASGCGSAGSNQRPFVAQSYTVTVTATSGTIQHSTAISVTVQ